MVGGRWCIRRPAGLSLLESILGVGGFAFLASVLVGTLFGGGFCVLALSLGVMRHAR